ncbi:hypothetical protein JTE90_021892 [Oedothorax gibbosus]|uniref:Uncharacterized protein n=1 Tax=Oedothorax gibbosus TaxID=931172 RepID=A0AAV6UY27_9ARAC|nr:hypothetical protein JTE90_021892 [Oedothorax gibbosus]
MALPPLHPFPHPKRREKSGDADASPGGSRAKRNLGVKSEKEGRFCTIGNHSRLQPEEKAGNSSAMPCMER